MVLGKPQTDPTLEWFLSHCHIHKYPSKSTLIHQGEKAETLYYIVKGSVAVLIKDEEGKEMILSYSAVSKTIETSLTNADKTKVTLQALSQENNEEMEKIRSEIVQISQKPANKIDTTLSTAKS